MLCDLQRFKVTMRELQGAIIISSLFQALLGYSGLFSILLRYLVISCLSLCTSVRAALGFVENMNFFWEYLLEVPSHTWPLYM
jgi:hypothetical protein